MNESSFSCVRWFEAACGGITADMNQVHEAFKRAPDGPVLDLGCGSGRILNLGLERDLILADCSNEFLSLARQKAEKHSNVRFIQAKAPQLPLEESSVACVTLMNNTLTELSPICFSLAEVARVLKKGGTVYSVTRNPKCKTEMTFGPRVIDIESEKMYSSYESFRMSSLGQNHYQTQITLRRADGSETKFFVPQYTLPKKSSIP